MPPKVRHFWGHINARVGTLHFAFFRSLMRCQKKLLIRDFAVDFCFAKIAVSANHVFAAQRWFDYPPAPNKNRPSYDGLFLFGGRGWIRTTEAEKQQIYSLPPLATRELAHNGAGDGTRTRNLLITNQLLCQLSYTSDESSPNVESFSTLTDYTI